MNKLGKFVFVIILALGIIGLVIMFDKKEIETVEAKTSMPELVQEQEDDEKIEFAVDFDAEAAMASLEKYRGSEFIGIWNTYEAVNSKTGKIFEELEDVFGEDYLSYGSFIKLNANGTFWDATNPKTSESLENEGTYIIEKKNEESYIVLKYDNGKTKELNFNKDEGKNILSLDGKGEAYQYKFKKQ